MLSTNCTVVTNRFTDTFKLPNSTGTGILETLVFSGQTNAVGSNLYSYFYRVDLTGVTAINSNLQSCFTNIVSGCLSNPVVVQTQLVSCVTNIIVPGQLTNVTCTTNSVTVTNTGCVTNQVPCPGATPCVESLRIRFGPVSTLAVTDSNGVVSTGEVFVVTSGGTGTVALASIQQTGQVITVNFGSSICPGSSSLYFGFVSSNAPGSVVARVVLNNDDVLAVDARAPRLTNQPINCDFSALSNVISQLGTNLLAPNSHARKGRLHSLSNAVNEAIEAAQAGDLRDVLEALGGINAKAQNKHKWFTAGRGAIERRVVRSPRLPRRIHRRHRQS